MDSLEVKRQRKRDSNVTDKLGRDIDNQKQWQRARYNVRYKEGITLDTLDA